MSSFLFDGYIVDKSSDRMVSIVNDNLGTIVATDKTPVAVCVDLNQMDVWVTNATGNSIEYKDGKPVDKTPVSAFCNTVSRYRDGMRMDDIAVGKTPMGICSAPDGIVYVTNYGSNTVSKIVNNRVVKTIPVGMGPRGICVTKDKKVYVANYLSSTVTVIVNDIVVETIRVGYNPMGICAGRGSFVWVACAGSNIVSVLNGLKKEVDINVGNMPYGICCDLNGVVYVTNYNDGTVSKIAGATVTKTIEVGEGPLSIAYNKDNELYVTNMLGHSVSKIVNDIEVTKINTSPFSNPCSFGDFIGGNAYYTHIYVPPATGGGSLITEADLDPLLQTKINSIVTLPLNATQVNHGITGSSTANVEEALEKLLVRKRQLYFVVGAADLVVGPAPMTFPLTFEAANGVTANSIIARLGTASSKAISFDVEREVKNTPVIGNDPSTGDPIYGPTTISWVPVQTVNIAPGDIEAKVNITDAHKYEVGEAIRINFTAITDEAENLTAVITFDEKI